MQALHEVRVVDFSHVIAGPFCSAQLGALGADVIKIEALGDGDMMRPEGADPALGGEGLGSEFVAQSGNKRSLAVDIGRPEGREVLQRLIAGADVVVENFRPGVMARHGLDADTLCARHPRLIYCSISGFGQTGPKSAHPAFDNVIQAFSGLMAMTGEADGDPVRVGPPVLDYGTGAQAAYAIAAALFRRERSGEGQCIDVSMLDCALVLMSNAVANTHITAAAPVRSGNGNPARPAYGEFATAEGKLMIGAYTVGQTVGLFRLLGLEAAAAALESGGRARMIECAAEYRALVAERLSADGAQCWEDRLNAAGVPAARVRTLDQTLREPQVAARGVLQPLQVGAAGGLRTPVTGFQSDRDGASIRRPAPRHGEHTAEVLVELGYDATQVAALQARGVVSGGQ